jgi:N-carbamoylputrescine amidase
MNKVKLAITQMACSWDRQENIDNAIDMVREAAAAGANIVLLQELFETPYFCKDISDKYFELATPVNENPAVLQLQPIARELGVVLPVSIFERSNNTFFNTLVMIDADGEILGKYRKSHIPDSFGYTEKYYFSPGDTGIVVWNTRFCRLSVPVCWDQWFPETARIATLQGAELILYPTAIGSEPNSTDTIALRHWQRAQQGHAAANVIPVAASNRIGTEQGDSCHMRFYGSSFITDHQGEIVIEASEDERQVLVSEIDLGEARRYRDLWNVFRDRRPDLYSPLMTLDGVSNHRY